MVWVTWRQHRGEAMAAVIVGVVLGALVLLTGIQMHNAFDAQGVGACVVPTPPPSCSGVAAAYQQQFSMYIAMYQWLNLVPLVLGIFVGAPLIAREVERNTHLLAWTQGVTRTRWIATKVLLLVAAAVLLGTGFTLLMTWWLQPLVAIKGGALAPDIFDLQGIAPVGYFAGALAIGIAAGTLIRRTIPAMGVAIVGFLVLRFGTIAILRPHFMAPLVSSALIGSPPAPSIQGAWVLKDALVDGAGHPINGRFAFEQLCGGADGTKQGLNACLQRHGVIESVIYQPADRFWIFQPIELGIFVGVAVVLLAVTVWWVRRRIS